MVGAMIRIREKKETIAATTLIKKNHVSRLLLFVVKFSLVFGKFPIFLATIESIFIEQILCHEIFKFFTVL